MTNESAHFPETDQSTERTGRISNFLKRARGALGSLLGQSGVMVEDAPAPVSVSMPDLNPRAREHLLGSPTDGQGMGPLFAEDKRMSHENALKVSVDRPVHPADLGVSKPGLPETGDVAPRLNLPPSTEIDPGAHAWNQGGDTTMRDVIAGDVLNIPGPGAVGERPVNPEQDFPVENRNGVVGQ